MQRKPDTIYMHPDEREDLLRWGAALDAAPPAASARDTPADDVLPPAAGTVLHRGGHVWLVLGPGAVEGFVPGSALASDYTLPVGGAWGMGEGPVPTTPAMLECVVRAIAYAERCGLTPRPWWTP